MLASHKLKELNGATTAGCDEAKRLNRAGSLERGGAVLDRRSSKPTSNQALTVPHERPLGRRSSQEWACRAFRSYGMGLGNSWPRPNRHI